MPVIGVLDPGWQVVPAYVAALCYLVVDLLGHDDVKP